MQEKQRKHGIVWFRNDLRVNDNTSLNTAIRNCSHVTAVYFFDPVRFGKSQWGFSKTGSHRLKFLLETLQDLQKDLSGLNIKFHFQTGDPEVHFPVLAKNWNIDTIYTQKEWTAEEVLQDQRVEQGTDIPLISQYDQFLVHPDDQPFRSINDIPEVFTQFRKTVEKQWEVRPVVTTHKKPAPVEHLPGLISELPSFKELGITPPVEDPRTAFPFKGGASKARERIDHYFWKTRKLQYYKRTRNGLCGPDYSSKLSPWLANGSISPRMIYQQVKKFEEEVTRNRDTYWLIFELLWRDYFKYISLKHGNRIFHISGIRNRNYDWEFSEEKLHDWIHGKTGNDFVDANMIELLKTGWMSNRGRQNVASFWAKDLKQDWRAGAAWFESALLDYDVHSNWGNWNYVSGVGNDPRDRKFNTGAQAERYDGSGKFRKLWLQNTLF